MNTLKTDWVVKHYTACAVISRTRCGNWEAHDRQGRILIGCTSSLLALERRLVSLGWVNYTHHSPGG